jgi:hypothetical protein
MPIVFSICLIARVVGTFFSSMRLKTRRLKATQSLTEVFSSWRRGKQDTCRRWVSSGVVGFPEVVANVWAILESSSSCFHSSLGHPSQRNWMGTRVPVNKFKIIIARGHISCHGGIDHCERERDCVTRSLLGNCSPNRMHSMQIHSIVVVIFIVVQYYDIGPMQPLSQHCVTKMEF